MQTKDIIKELDPEYIECCWCMRILHISKLTKIVTLFRCVEREDCDAIHRASADLEIIYECQRLNQRNRS